MSTALAANDVSLPEDVAPAAHDPDLRAASEPRHTLWLALAGVAVAGLLSAPLSTVWLGVATLIVVLVGCGRTLIRRGGLPFGLAMAPYLAGGLVGYWATIHPDTAGIRLSGIMAGISAFVLVALAARTPAAARRVAILMLATTLVATPIVFLIVMPFIPLERFPNGLTSVSGFSEPLRSFVLDQDDILQRYRLRASGLGTLAGFGVALSLGPLIVGPTQTIRMLSAASIAFFALFLILAANRGAMVTAIAVSAAIIVIGGRWKRSHLVGLGGIALVAAGLVAFVSTLQASGLSPFTSTPLTDLGSVLRRAEFWNNSIFLIGDFKFTGVGLGLRSVQEIYETYFLPSDPRFSHAHNIFLQSYLEQGMLGFIGMLGFVLVVVLSGHRALSLNDSDHRWAALSSLGAVLTLLFGGLTEVVALTSIGMVMFGSASGLLTTLASRDITLRLPRSHAPAITRARVGVTAGAIAALVVPATLYAQGESATRNQVPGASSLIQEVQSAFYLNAGNTELMKVTLGAKRSREERDERLTRAEENLNRAIELDSSSSSALRALASVHATQSQRSAARRALSQAEQLAAADDLGTAFQIGRIYREIGDIEPAIEAWTRARAGTQIVQWGAALIRRSQWRQAVDVNRAGIRVSPTERSPWQGLAISLDQIRGRPVAIETMERLARLYPAIPWPYLAAGDLYANDGDIATARDWYSRGLAVAPGESTLTVRLEGRRSDENPLPSED